MVRLKLRELLVFYIYLLLYDPPGYARAEWKQATCKAIVRKQAKCSCNPGYTGAKCETGNGIFNCIFLLSVKIRI